jgi:hypothetical protein
MLVSWHRDSNLELVAETGAKKGKPEMCRDWLVQQDGRGSEHSSEAGQ